MARRKTPAIRGRCKTPSPVRLSQQRKPGKVELIEDPLEWSELRTRSDADRTRTWLVTRWSANVWIALGIAFIVCVLPKTSAINWTPIAAVWHEAGPIAYVLLGFYFQNRR